MTTIDILKRVDDQVLFSAGTTVIEEGTPGSVMYLVKEGTLEVCVHGRVVATAGPGEIVGELALIDAQARSASVVARSDVRLVPVDEKRFLFLVQQAPYFALQVMRTLAERLRRTNEIITS